MLKRYLEDIEARIDDEVEQSLLDEWTSFAHGEFGGELFIPMRLRPSPPRIDWPTVRVNETLDDYDKMALQQLRECSERLACRGGGGGALMNLRCNYGTGIMSSLFGAELFVMPDQTDTLPTTWPMNGADAARKLLDEGVRDLSACLGAKVFEMGERFVELMRPYPKIRRHVHIYHPDVQGPMDICELLWGSGLFVDLVDQPRLVQSMLELITQTYIRFMRKWETIAPPPQPAVHWGFAHRGRIMLREDSAMNLSPAMFDQFIRPYDQKLLDTFGGGALHFCGRGDHYLPSACEMPGLYAITMSQPEYNDMEVIYRNTVDKGIQMLGLDRDVAEQALQAGRDLHASVQCW